MLALVVLKNHASEANLKVLVSASVVSARG